MVMNLVRAARPARLTALRAPVLAVYPFIDLAAAELTRARALARSVRPDGQRAMTTRFYSPESRSEGATGSSKGFSQREQAEEGQYIRKRELEQLKKAQDKLKAAQEEVDAQQKKVDSAKD